MGDAELTATGLLATILDLGNILECLVLLTTLLSCFVVTQTLLGWSYISRNQLSFFFFFPQAERNVSELAHLSFPGHKISELHIMANRISVVVFDDKVMSNGVEEKG